MLRIPPVVLLLIATILWGGNFVIGRAVVSDLPPYTLAFLRWCTAFVFFLPFAWTSLKQDWPTIRKHFPIVILMAITGVASFNTVNNSKNTTHEYIEKHNQESLTALFFKSTEIRKRPTLTPPSRPTNYRKVQGVL